MGDFIKPLDHVDILAVFKRDGDVVVRTLVQDVVVLAVGEKVTPVSPPQPSKEGQQQAAPRRTQTPVTLALTPAQAQLVLAADRAGEIRLALRGKKDQTVVALPPAQSWALMGIPPRAVQKAGPSAAPAPSPAPTAAPPAPPAQKEETKKPQESVKTAAPRPPTEPYVEVIRGSEREIVVP